MVACRNLMLVLLVAGLLTGCRRQTLPSSEPTVEAPADSPARAEGATAPHSQARQNKDGRDGTTASTPYASGVPMPRAGGMPDQHPGGMSMPPTGGMPGQHPGGMSIPHAGRVPDPHAMIAGGTKAQAPQPTETKLDGITLKVPQGWIYEVPRVNQRMPSMSPKAVFTLAPVEGDSDNVYVRVTHFPQMRVPDETNLQRWYSMLRQPDGRPTEAASTAERFDVGDVKVVLADIPGDITVGGRTKTGWRMLGAIVKHEKGPHFVKVVGPTRSVEHWKASVVAYLKSAKVN